jgi:starvation-inducible outer membrane lipoprotein
MTTKKTILLYSLAFFAAVLTACTTNPTAADEAASKEVDHVPVATAKSRTGSTVAPDSKSLSGTKMQNSLLGVWHENSPEGKNNANAI